jgi:hypothetical protein
MVLTLHTCKGVHPGREEGLSARFFVAFKKLTQLNVGVGHLRGSSKGVLSFSVAVYKYWSGHALWLDVLQRSSGKAKRFLARN